MRVPAQNHVDIACSGNQMFIHLNAQMRQAYYQITTFFVFQQSSYFVGYADRIFINDSFAFISLNHPFGLGSKAKHTNSQTIFLKNDVGFNYIFQYRSIQIIVGTNDREISHLENTFHIIHIKIKLMVTDSHSVITHFIH